MSRPRHNARKGPQLPVALQQKLGLQRNNSKQRTQIADRKQKRQEGRRRRHIKEHGKQAKHGTSENEESLADLEDVEEEDDEELLDVASDDGQQASRQSLKVARTEHKTREPSPPPQPSPKEEELSDDLSRGSREYSPEIVLDANSQTFRDRQAEEDAEILALEKKLGVKGRGKVFDDGFDDLLADLEDVIEPRKRKREEKEWLEKKRRKLQAHTSEHEVRMESGSDDDHELEDDELIDLDDSAQDGAEDDFEGFDENEEDAGSAWSNSDPPKKQPTRENPYVAPMVDGSAKQKYVPPSLRKLPDTDTEKLDKLKRQAQGSLNKLSEANIISIVDEFEKLYQTNPRQDVTGVLVDLLLAAFAIPSALQNTFIILHAAFVAALYKIQGADFGAETLSRLVETFDKYHKNPGAHGKETLNLTSLLANLFTFGVASSALVYDHVRILLSDFGENSAELLLRIMRDSGPQLRSDDPAALKGIVQMMNDVAAKMTQNGETINVRTRVMMDTITDLKNNKIRQATNAAGATGEHLTRMRKALGSLHSRQLRATEPLGITRSDILNSDKKGKWWLVGASWKGRDQSAPDPMVATKNAQTVARQEVDPDGHDAAIDYPTLFIHYKLTSPVHRSIFVAITSATDGTDALQRLAKLRLTRKQELEIAPVILRACRAEPQFNPYYGVLSKMLLREKRYRMPFSIGLWKFFETLGEKQNDDDVSDTEQMGDSDVQMSEIANVARLYAYLIAKRSLTLDVLKTLSIGFTQENTSIFLEVLFITLFARQLKTEKLVDIFSSGVDPAKSNSLSYFLKKNVRRSDIITDREQRQKVKQGVDLAVAALAAMAMDGIDVDEDE